MREIMADSGWQGILVEYIPSIMTTVLAGGFIFGLWRILTRQDVTVSTRQGMNPEGLRYGSGSQGFGSAKIDSHKFAKSNYFVSCFSTGSASLRWSFPENGTTNSEANAVTGD